jgi:hypothetical protein
METRDLNPSMTPTAVPHARTGSVDEHDGLVKAGYWTAVLIAPVGFIIGIVLLTKDKTRQGVTAMILAITVTVIVSASLAAANGDDKCIVLANGGRTLCGAEARAWCDSTDSLRTVTDNADSQAICDELRQ